jgi:hypothetical protein
MKKAEFIKKFSKIEDTFEDEFRAEYNSPELIWEALKKQLFLYGVVKRTLERKIAAYELVKMWFEKDYNTGSDIDEVESMEKEAAELNAQIKILRYIDSTVKIT